MFNYIKYTKQIDGVINALEKRRLKIMANNCICKNQRYVLQNNHFLKRNIELILMGSAGYRGIVLFENHDVIATFDINYCPMCGKKLN